MFISAVHNIIKARHPEDQSMLKGKCQNSNTNDAITQSLVILIQNIPQGNTGSSFSRDIQEAVQKQPVKGQCSINPPWQLHSFNTVWIHQDLYFIHTTWEDHSTQFISQFGKVHIP
ncbi:hypothetical protein O181_110598 [Austropuccinia psidii MF-1]|uniref:Uncharacterized protein n=1 Tax=Austropuccinia psidii MF-1 TaxID=1389203 RepID=A0A9Q3JY36_9BASI|nr:hypothetical protein [Austropuccinia psidii MF-1]